MKRWEKRHYSLQIIAQTFGVHPQAIRLYEREGLITSVRSGKERYYAPAEVERLRVIIQLRQELGINLAGIEVILGMRDRLQQLREMVQELGGPETSKNLTATSPAGPLVEKRIPIKEEP